MDFSLAWTDLWLPVLLALFFVGGLGLSAQRPGFRRGYFQLLRWLLQPVIVISWLLRELDRRLSRPHWTISGSCTKCGRCCELLAMGVPRGVARRPYLLQAIGWYYEINYGFILEEIRDERWLLFSCANLTAEGLCGIYPRRPRICREYPNPFDPDPPHLPDECSFRLDGR